MKVLCTLLGIALLFTSCSVSAFADGPDASNQSPAEQKLPKVVLIGDSIRLSYAPIVKKQLQDQALIVSPKANCGDSSKILANLQKWVIDEQPDLVHLNCGIHDTKKFETGKFQVSPEQYKKNLKQIIARIRKETNATIIFATSTPILDKRAAKTRAGRNYVLLDESIRKYNKIATGLMLEEMIPVNDLYLTLKESPAPLNLESLIAGDGVHLQEPGRKLLGEKVAKAIQHQMSLRKQGAFPGL